MSPLISAFLCCRSYAAEKTYKAYNETKLVIIYFDHYTKTIGELNLVPMFRYLIDK